MKLHEIYGLPASVTAQDIELAARRHAAECARGMHGSILPVRLVDLVDEDLLYLCDDCAANDDDE